MTLLILLEVAIVMIFIIMMPATMTVVTAVTLMQTETIVHYVSVMKSVIHQWNYLYLSACRRLAKILALRTPCTDLESSMTLVSCFHVGGKEWNGDRQTCIAGTWLRPTGQFSFRIICRRSKTTRY